jgi:hypothetical protein
LGRQFITTKDVQTGGSGVEQDTLPPSTLRLHMPLEPEQRWPSLTVTHWYESAHPLSAVHDVGT